MGQGLVWPAQVTARYREFDTLMQGSCSAIGCGFAPPPPPPKGLWWGIVGNRRPRAMEPQLPAHYTPAVSPPAGSSLHPGKAFHLWLGCTFRADGAQHSPPDGARDGASPATAPCRAWPGLRGDRVQMLETPD